MDSFRAHITDAVKKELRKANCDVAIIPGGCTSKIQPLDVSINRPYKSWMRCKFEHYLQSEVEKLGDDIINKIQTAKKHDVLKWISECSYELEARKELIQKSFIVTGIAPALNGSDDHAIRNENYLKELFTDEDVDEEEFDGFVV